jgi:hypothetical protein
MTDDDLRETLRHADPAASLAPLPPDRVSRLLEETVTIAPPRRRALLPVLAAAAAVLLIAGAGWLILRPSPVETVGTLAGSPETSVAPVHLTAPAAPAAKCRPPEENRLATFPDFAFAGTVISVGDVVTLSVTKVYKGSPAVLVTVDQQPDSSETMMGSGKFETGRDYLIAASGGTVMICGYSGEADAPGLLGLYEGAFPG